MIDKIRCERKFGSDIHKYLIALLKQAQLDTSIFPTTISKEEYLAVKNNKDNYDDWYVGLVGFCASYNGKWFDSYANGVKTKIGTIRNYTDESIKNIIKQSRHLSNIIFNCCSYKDINSIENYVIYCDPPYKNVAKYKVDNFDYDDFYNWCRKMSENNIVLISEYYMPDDFKCIWSTKYLDTMGKSARTIKNEKLFIYKN